LDKVQFELNLKTTELKLRAQPSAPLEVKEQCAVIVKDAVVAIDVIVKECTALFEQSFKVFTNLQEDSIMQRLEKRHGSYNRDMMKLK